MNWGADGTCRVDCHVYCVICLLVTMAFTAGLKERLMHDYDGCQVWRIPTQNNSQWNSVVSELHLWDLDVWKYAPSGGWVDVLVPRDRQTHLRHILGSNSTLLVTHNNLKNTIRKERSQNYRRSKRDNHRQENFFRRYARYSEILSWMDHIASLHPSVASIIDIGKTHEGRPIRILKVGDPAPQKWKLWLDGGTHAREWISVSTVLYIAHKLINGYEKNDTIVHSLLKKLDFYFLPVVNPDGYEYTHTTDRLWRKNRQAFNYSGCHGIDLNRNWNYKWGGASSSTNPCSAVYRGNSPEEAVEVRSIINFLRPRSDAFLSFITYHSYGQNFVSRWDYSKHAIPRDDMQLMALAKKATRKMQRVNGVSYDAGRGPQILYPYGGGSADWAKGVAGIKYSYLVELRDEYSFIIPPSQIKTTGEENWAAVRLISRELINAYRHKVAPPSTPDQLMSHPHENENIVGITTGSDTKQTSSSGTSSSVNSGGQFTIVNILIFIIYMYTFE